MYLGQRGPRFCCRAWPPVAEFALPWAVWFGEGVESRRDCQVGLMPVAGRGTARGASEPLGSIQIQPGMGRGSIQQRGERGLAQCGNSPSPTYTRPLAPPVLAAVHHPAIHGNRRPGSSSVGRRFQPIPLRSRFVRHDFQPPPPKHRVVAIPESRVAAVLLADD